MAVMDEFKEERERMKAQPFKVRLAYFWDYHKFHVLAAAFVPFFVINLGYSWLTQKDTAFMAMFINCYANEEKSEAYTTALTEKMAIDTKKEEIHLDYSVQITGGISDYETSQLVGARMAAKEVDVMVTDETTFEGYTKSDAFLDLSQVLTPEQYEYYKDSFYYIDYALIESGYYDNIDYTTLETTKVPETIDHHSQEGMEKPVPVGIYVDAAEGFKEAYHFKSGQDTVFGVIGYVEGEHLDHSLLFLDIMTGRVE